MSGTARDPFLNRLAELRGLNPFQRSYTAEGSANAQALTQSW